MLTDLHERSGVMRANEELVTRLKTAEAVRVKAEGAAREATERAAELDKQLKYLQVCVCVCVCACAPARCVQPCLCDILGQKRQEPMCVRVCVCVCVCVTVQAHGRGPGA